MGRIYTRGGDKGKTHIFGGGRVDKDDTRIEAVGTLDELNAQLGIVRTLLPMEDESQAVLYKIQFELMGVMSLVVTPSPLIEQNPNPLPERMAKYCEEYIDKLLNQLPESAYFILPGGTPTAAHLHMARTLARRAERRLWKLNREDAVPSCIMEFINRLSDLLFVMARFELYRDGAKEEQWKLFHYKRKKK